MFIKASTLKSLFYLLVAVLGLLGVDMDGTSIQM